MITPTLDNNHINVGEKPIDRKEGSSNILE